MGLVLCPDCTKQISDLAPACIHCGRPMAARPANAPAAGGAHLPMHASANGETGVANTRVTGSSLQREVQRYAPPVPPADGLACPKCASPDVRRLSIVHQNGISSIESSTSGVGWAGGLAVGHAHSSGVQQSVLSRQAAPPARKDASASFIAVSLGGMLALAGLVTNTPAVFVLFLGAAVWGGYALRDVLRYNRQVHPQRLETWRASFMCLRCGDVFVSGGS